MVELKSRNAVSLVRGVAAVILPFCVCSLATAENVAIEEIVVTALKRSQEIQDVPISMLALSGDDLEELRVIESTDIGERVPNLSVTGNEGNPQFYIRGVGTTGFHLNRVNAVGLYMDEVSINNAAMAAAFGLYDMERVEVMRGPQNTLFGRNTTGGAIQFISRKPEIGRDVNGRLNVSYGRFNQFDAGIAVGLPIGETAAARIAFQAHDRDGIFDNRFLGTEVGAAERYSARGQLLWEPSPQFDVLFNVHGASNRGHHAIAKFIGLRDPADPSQACPVGPSETSMAPVPNSNLSAANRVELGMPCSDRGGNVDTGDPEEVFNNVANPRNHWDSVGGFVRINWDTQFFSISSVTAYDEIETIRNHDNDGGPFTYFEFSQEGDVDSISQDIRLASIDEKASHFRWIAGFYFFHEDATYGTFGRRFFPRGPLRPPDGVPAGADLRFPPTIVQSTIAQQDNTVYSGYGQAEYRVTEALTAIIGLRYTSESKKGENSFLIGNAGGIPFSTVIGIDEVFTNPPFVQLPTEFTDGTWDEWGGKFGLDYAVNEDILLYGSASRGFKGGGFSIAPAQALFGGGALPVEPETLWSYEIGAKTSWLDRSLQINLAVFHNDWKDQQLFVVGQLSPGVIGPFLANVEESHSTGFEAEAIWIPSEGWRIQAGIGFTDGQIDEGGTRIATIRSGNDLPATPKVTFNGYVSREWRVGDGVLAIQTNFRHFGRHTLNATNDRRFIEGDYWILNAGASYRFGPDQRYEISLWGKNLTETDYCVHRQTTVAGIAGSVSCELNEPVATYGISGTMRY